MLDMLVVGGGYVGLSAAVAVKQAAPHLYVMVVEAPRRRLAEGYARLRDHRGGGEDARRLRHLGRNASRKPSRSTR